MRKSPVAIAMAAAAWLFTANAAMGQQDANIEGVDPAWLREYQRGIEKNLGTYLKMNDLIRTPGVTFTVDINVVTLRGTVPDRVAQDRVIEAARLTHGVGRVVNEMKIANPDLALGELTSPRVPPPDRR